jgi:ABC-2 type transport system ATP-binding protein
MLELRNVSKRFAASLVVDNVSFRARRGEVTGYLGPNGSGKSTTMKMIVGLIDTTAGKICFEGNPIQRDPVAWKQRLGYVPEEPHLYGHLSGLEYLGMVGQLRDLPARATADRIDGLLRLLALHDDRHVPVSASSTCRRTS